MWSCNASRHPGFMLGSPLSDERIRIETLEALINGIRPRFAGSDQELNVLMGWIQEISKEIRTIQEQR